MDRELIIKLGLDRSRAEAQSEAFQASERARIAQMLAAYDAAEKARATSAEQGSKARAMASAEERRQIGKSLLDWEAAERGKAEAVRRSTQQARDALGRFVGDAKGAQEFVKEGWEGAESAIGKAAGAVTSFGAQMLGLNSAQAVVSTIVEAFKAAKKEAMDAGKFVESYREALLELAALKGKLGDTTSGLKEDLAFRAQTLQTADQAKQFQEAALGRGQSAIDEVDAQGKVTKERLISPEEQRKAMIYGGKFQATEGGSATTHGEFVGSIPLLYKKRMTAEEIFAKEQHLYNINQPGGSSFTSAINQYNKNMAFVSAGLMTPEEMMAEQAALSLSDPEGAGTRVQQLVRATVGGLGRMKGMKGMEGAENEKLAEYYKKLGATDQMGAIEIADLVSKDLENQEKAAAARGEKFNPMFYLQTHGQTNMEDANTMLLHHGLRMSGTLETFRDIARTPVDPKQAVADLESAQARDPVFRKRRRDLSKDLSQIPKGLQEEELRDVLEPVFNQLKGDKQITGEYEDVMSSTWYNSPKEAIFGQRRRVELEAQEQLASEARKRGIDPGIEYRYDAKTGAQVGANYMGDERLVELSRRVRAAGGDSQPAVAASATKADEALAEQNRTLRSIEAEVKKANEQRAQRGNPPIQGRPNVRTR